MPEEFKPGCQRPPIKKPKTETAPSAILGTLPLSELRKFQQLLKNMRSFNLWVWKCYP